MNDPQPPAVDDKRDPAFKDVYPPELFKQERRLLRKRRAEAKLLPSDDQVGVGLSGGGIRSATFALGIFQGLAKSRKEPEERQRTGLLRYIDFLSTVSGGGYFGSFFGRLLTRDYVETPEDVEDTLLGRKNERVLGFLRENGRYLSPNGGGDALLSGAAVLRNGVSIHIVLSLFLLAVFLGLQVLRTGLGFAEISQEPGDLIWWSPLLWLPLLTFVLAAVPLGWAYWLVEPERAAITGDSQEVSAIPPLAGLILVFVVASLLAAFTWGQLELFVLWASLAAVALLTIVFWKFAERRVQRELPDEPTTGLSEEARQALEIKRALHLNHGIRNRLGTWLAGVLAGAVLLLVLAVVDSLGQSVYAVLKGDGTLGAWLAAVFGSLGVLAGFSRSIAMFFSKGPQGPRPSLPVALIAGVAALIIVLLLLVAIDAGSHAIAFGLSRPEGAPARLLEKSKEERSMSVDVWGGGPVPALDLRVCTGSPEDCRPGDPKPVGKRNAMLAFLGFASTLLLSVLFGQTFPFVNRSSHLPLYAARLTRAYLGASNKNRWNGTNITQPVEGDDSDLTHYWPPPSKNGSPIHLINVTINETVGGQSQVQQQDRKGLGLALGPWGLSAGARHHIVVPLGEESEMLEPEEAPVYAIYPERKKPEPQPTPEPEPGPIAQAASAPRRPANPEPKEESKKEPEFRVFEYPERKDEDEKKPRDPKHRQKRLFTGESLSLGTWLSISGAAFSTGTGHRTSLGLSLLAGLANVRLGRWWDSGVVRQVSAKSRARRKISLRIEDVVARLFPVQTYLLDEFLARFPGTARRHWYLSDGGHFENMGGYELLRRRLRFILIVDAEMDADFTFNGLANLVRKARLDFGAEVRFLTEKQLDEGLNEDVRPYIGTLAQLKRGEWKDTLEDESKPHGRLEKPGRDGFSLAHAALARVSYDDSDPDAYSWLLYVKPTVTGREPVDILEYHAAHTIFPHEPTIDQFFDEAQWESYRRLGEHIADVLFGCLDGLLPESGKTLLKKRWDWVPGWEAEEAQAPQDMKPMETPQPLLTPQPPQDTKVRRMPRYS